MGGIARSPWRRFWFGQPHVVFEYRFTGTQMTVRVWVPAVVNTGAVIDAAHAAWPGSRCTVEAAQAPLPGDGQSAGGRLVWTSMLAEPVTVAAPADRLRGLISAGTELGGRSTAAVHITARPASPREARALRRVADGGLHRRSLLDEVLSLVGLDGGPPSETAREAPTLTRHRNQARDRLGGLLWATGLRWAVAAPEAAKPRTVAAHSARLGAACAGLCATAGIRRKPLPGARAWCNTWAPESAAVLTSAEIAALAHLPADEVVPAIDRAGARPVAAPAAARSGGRNTKPLGVGPDGRKLAIATADGRHHLHLLGATGSGKSTLMQHLILADIRDRRGCVVLDPKGDLVDDLLDHLDPAQVEGRLVLIDPAAPSPRPGLDPLAGTDPELAIDHFTGICRRIWERHWGPRADDITRHVLRTLVLAGDPALHHIPSLLTKKAYRAPLVAAIDDPISVGGFWEWFDALPAGVQVQAAGPVLSRMRALLGREFVRETIGSPDHPVDLAAALDKGGIVLARLPKGVLGDDTARLLGSILVAKVWQAATARAATPEHRRRDAVFYIDECQNFLNLPHAVEDMLAEARGLRLGMVLAHQHLAQLDRDLQYAISANARTKVFFTCSPEDARQLSRHTLPNLGEHDLARLEAHTAAVRVLADGRELPAATITTLPPTEPVGHATELRRMAAVKPAFTALTIREYPPWPLPLSATPSPTSPS